MKKINLSTIIIVALLAVIGYMYLTDEDSYSEEYNELKTEQELIKAEKQRIEEELIVMKDSLEQFRGVDSIFNTKDSIAAHKIDSIQSEYRKLEEKLSEQSVIVNDLKKEVEKIRKSKEKKSPINLMKDIKNNIDK